MIVNVSVGPAGIATVDYLFYNCYNRGEVEAMILNIDLASKAPIYQQLRDQIVEAIAEGVLTEGSSLPATRTLAADFGINFHTVNKAYDLLRQQGLIRLNRKSGAVVSATAAEPPFHSDWAARARTLLAEAVARGIPPDEVLRTCSSTLDSFGAKQREDRP
jgi:GntR family transcriptional regulator